MELSHPGCSGVVVAVVAVLVELVLLVVVAVGGTSSSFDDASLEWL